MCRLDIKLTQHHPPPSHEIITAIDIDGCDYLPSDWFQSRTMARCHVPMMFYTPWAFDQQGAAGSRRFINLYHFRPWHALDLTFQFLHETLSQPNRPMPAHYGCRHEYIDLRDDKWKV